MTPEQRAAHLRLLASLPSRIHEMEVLRPATNSRKAWVYRGALYASQKDLKIALGVGSARLRYLIDSGIIRRVR